MINNIVYNTDEEENNDTADDIADALDDLPWEPSGWWDDIPFKH